MTSKRIIVGVGVVAALGVVFAYWSGLMPPKKGVEGAIGAAQRYQSEQIADKDVVTQDQELQALLQSDVFHKLQTDPAYEVGFRVIVGSRAFEEAAKTGNYAELDKKVEAELAAKRTSIEEARTQLNTAERRYSETQRAASVANSKVTATDISNARIQVEQAKRGLAEAQKASVASKTEIEAQRRLLDAEKRSELARKAYETEKKPAMAAKMEVARKDVEAARRDLVEAQKASVANKTGIDAQKQVVDAEKRMIQAEKAYQLDKSATMASKLEVARRDVEQAKRSLAETQKAGQVSKSWNAADASKQVIGSELFKQMLAQHGAALTELAKRPQAFAKLQAEVERRAGPVPELNKTAAEAGN